MKLDFFTERDGRGGFVGRCLQRPELIYRPSMLPGSRSAALSGIKRLVVALNRLGAALNKVSLPSVKPTPSSKRKVNRVVFVIDRSGSMGSLHHNAMAALRANIKTLQEQTLATGQETLVSLVSFDDSIAWVCKDVPVERLSFSDNAFLPRGSTALFDAVGAGITDIQNTHVESDVDPAYVVITITDGHENASRTYGQSALWQLMRDVQVTDRWTLSFLLPPGQKFWFCRQFNVPEGNVAEWELSAAGVQRASAATSIGLRSVYASRASGQNSVKDFYMTDMSKVTTADLKKKLVDIRDSVKVWTVEGECKIRDFCEQKSGQNFLRGAAFYALTKEEKKVQPYKKILIMEKGGTKVYGGDDARSILGLPDRTVKVIPGNHSNYDIFVQSTSTNRMCVRGTKVIYYPAVGVPYKEGKSARNKRR